MSLSVFYYCICAFLCRSHNFNLSLCCLSLFQGQVAGWNFSQNRASLMFQELGKGGSHR